ncbi:MAG: alanine--tRNA ligase [Actinobacteria bacterium]|nr:alanine--tRNA ligase [Actinomycetota bacterium]
MRSDEIRATFLDFFAERDHRVWPSASLIPSDPTLLLTVAGMVPFKPYFLGEATPETPRAVSIQKCARTLDIENVGHTTRHLTFFEMLGNFSFGDYFKADAIRWAYELSTEGFGFDPERLWATVYLDDDEAFELWVEQTAVPPERVQRRGKEDNYWDMGVAGPCGPCSEIFYDRGPEHGPDGGPVVDESRFLEFWNLVFMQYVQDDDGNVVADLPNRNVDTGMGFERLAMLLQDVPNVYETDVIRPMIDRAVDLTGVGYGAQERSDISLRVIAEHARSASFLIADGVLPSNEARGYILRRLLRRAVRHLRLLGSDRPVLPEMMTAVIDTLGPAWPDLVTQRELTTRVAAAEEDSFGRTLRTGMNLLSTAIDETKRRGERQLSGSTAFKLHDTYGFPVELTLEIAAEKDLTLDRDVFAAEMEAQRQRARSAAKRGDSDGPDIDAYRRVAKDGVVEFVGYDRSAADASVAALFDRVGGVARAQEGDEVEVVLRVTPFYAEGGGQLGDHGIIETPTGRLVVTDTVEPFDGLIVHRARVGAGEVEVGQEAHAQIDVARRASITRGHTATHILHATLKDELGDHAAQAGSAIDAGRFRFDFPHFSAVSADQLEHVEGRVNERIVAAPEISTAVMSQAEARRIGATALFGEKYGEVVRVVRIGDFSVELCGGTHVERTPDIGVFSILSEGSIAANLRRIEALTGPEALRHLARERLVAEQVAQLLKVSTDEVVDRVAGLVDRLRATEKELARSRQQALLSAAGQIADSAERVDGAQVLAAAVQGADRDGLKTLALDLRQRLGESVVVLGDVTDDGKAQLVAAVSAELVARGLEAREVLQPGARLVGGGAGGRGEVAQAGGRDGAQLSQALDACRRTARELVVSLSGEGERSEPVGGDR